MRKRFSALFLCLVLLLSLLSGCNTNDQPVTGEPQDSLSGQIGPEPEEPVEEEDEPNVIGVAWQSTADLHPYTSNSVTNQTIISLMYEGLFLVTANFEVEALLCSACAVSPNGYLWHFEIREDARFSDGSRVTAEDVVASLEMARDSALYDFRFDYISRITAISEYAVDITLNMVCESLPALLDLPILKASTISDPVPVGTGAYYLRGETLVRNPYWWNDQPPVVNAERINLIEANSALEVRNAFEFGGADLAYVDTSATGTSTYHGDNESWGCSTTVMEFIGFNQTGNYFSNAMLRCAVCYAVDRDTIVADIYGGFGTAAELPCPPQAVYYDNGLADDYAFSMERAHECMAASGVSPDPADPVRIVVTSSNTLRMQTAHFIEVRLKELGLFVQVDELSEDDFMYALYTNEFDIYLTGIRMTPNLDLYKFFLPYTGACYGGTESESIRSFCTAAMENSGNFYDLYRTVMSTGAICPIFFKEHALYATRGVVGSHTPSVSNLFISSTGVAVNDIMDPDDYVQQTG